MVENLPSMVGIFIYLHHIRESIPGLFTCVKIMFVSFNMLVQPQMLAADGVLPNQLVWAGTNPTQDFTNTLWKIAQSICRLEMSNI